VVEVGRPFKARTGGGREFSFPEGRYIYIGKASRGLAARLERHLGIRRRRRFWHVDYLLEKAEVVEVWVFPLEKGECSLARDLEREGGERRRWRGFGSSDCRCPGHLVFLGKKKPGQPAEVRTALRLR
jgi:Uri superfamily endonuclease